MNTSDMKQRSATKRGTDAAVGFSIRRHKGFAACFGAVVVTGTVVLILQLGSRHERRMSVEDSGMTEVTADNPVGTVSEHVLAVEDVSPAEPLTGSSEGDSGPSEAIENMRAILVRVFGADLSRGIPEELAGEVVAGLKDLGTQGESAVPIIRDFLARDQDVPFTQSRERERNGNSSLRVAMIETLQEIGGAEAIKVLTTTLQTTAEPAEIALLARSLEKLSPGEFRREILKATEETLEQAARGALGQRDVGPLFHTAELFGDASVLEDIARKYPHWQYYSTLAMASLPDGQGIESLTRAATNPEPLQTGKSALAFRMLAQAAGRNSEAATVLVEQADADKIPAQAWSQIAAGLSGDQYQYGSPLLDENVPREVEASIGVYQVHSNQTLYVHTPSTAIPGLRTYHVAGSNENFYSVPVSAAVDRSGDEEAMRRLETVERLLATGRSSAGIKALQEAREVLKRQLRN